MNTIIEEIRKRIKATSENTDGAGPYDEFESGQGVGLTTALQIIDEVEKEQSATKEIDFEEAVYKAFGQVKDFTLAIRIARYFYNLNPKHNGFKWHKLSEQLPPLGVPVLAFHHNWINADFNPEGIRIGHLQENCSSYDGKYDFCSAHWWNYQDCFVTISKSDIEGKEQGFSDGIVNSIMPEYWIELPMFNPKHK